MFVLTGATGHVGSAASRELLAAKERVRVFVRDAKKAEPLERQGAEVALGTLEDSEAMAAAFRGAEGAFVLIPPNYPPTGVLAWQRRLADAIAAAVRQSKLPRVVMLSSVGAELPDGTGPIRGLHYLEGVLRETGTQLTAVRAGYFQENAASALGAARQAGIFPNTSPSADAPFPMIATRDIGALVAHELRFPSPKSEVVDLHGPAYSIRQVAEKLGKHLGKQLRVVDIPPDQQVGAMEEAGMPREIAELYAEMAGAFASGRVKPAGDRLKLGRTPLDAVIAEL